MKKQKTLGETLKQLQDITEWFEQQQEADIETGLAKIKEGALLLRESKDKLRHIENEFEEIKKTLE